MDGIALFAISFIVWMMCAVICTLMADAKNRSSIGWLFLGFLFGPAAVLILAATSPVATPQTNQQEKYAMPAHSRPHPVSVVADELAKLADLKDRGALTEDEFADQKAKLLA